MNLARLMMLLILSLCVLPTSISVMAADKQISFDDFVKNKTLKEGYFSFYHDEEQGKVYLQIERFDQQFLFQSSLPQGIGSNDIGLDRGQLGDTRLVQFERVGNKVFLRQLNPYYRADSDNLLEQQAVDEAFASSILWGFPVVASSKVSDKGKETSNKVLIDYTPFLLSDIHHLGAKLKSRKQGSFKIDSSRSALYAKRSKAFPKNTELEAMVTFKGSGAGQYLRSVTPDASAVTVHLHHSLIKLPDNNYQTRTFHPYSGFWSIEYADYASAIDEPLLKRVIPRHRLSKNAQGEAVEPIVYYLDAGVPEPVRSALIEGAMWWQQAFAAIGYKNAFQVKMLPADADPMDVRYNVIQWVHRSTRGWSYGSSVIDPRTGEILKGHVTLGSLRVRQDYLIALGLTSPFSKKNADTSKMKAMALARIRQLSAHEVGHTLGIAHNFSASVNNRSSVMDYPHPLIELKNGEIDLSNAYAENIGVWDKYVIAYGYGDYNKADESQQLSALITKAQAQGLQYMSDPDARPKSGAHNSGHLWDNGKNAAQELSRVMQVRAKALANFGMNSVDYGTPLSEIEKTLVPIYNFHRYQVEAAAKLIAGVNYSYEVKTDQAVAGVKAVSAKQQNAALTALLSTLDPEFLTLPAHITELIVPQAYGYGRSRESFSSQTGLIFDPVTAAQASAKHTLALLLNAQRLARLAQQASVDKQLFNVSQLFKKVVDYTIKQRVSSVSKSKASTGMTVLVQQRVNQQVIDQLLALWHQQALVPEVRAELFVALINLQAWLDDHNNSRNYRVMSAQFKLFEQQIKFSLSQGKTAVKASEITMPPGSPIGS